MFSEIAPGIRQKCPHCNTVVLFEQTTLSIDGIISKEGLVTGVKMSAPKRHEELTISTCPNCINFIINSSESEVTLWPQTTNRTPVPDEVPAHIKQDYNEAALVFPFSPKASAALSRRCIQVILTECGLSTKRDLSDQIVEAISKLPGYIADNLDAVRNIGNFASHQQKSKNTGEILDVEPGEAEWNLDVLDSLFDFCYVRPETEKKKRVALDAKLIEAGKPPLKTP